MGTGAITATAIVVAMVGVAVVLDDDRRRGGPHGWRSLARAVVALGAAGAVGAVAVAATSQPRWLFPVVHLAYLVASIAVPATGLALAAVALRRRGRTAVVVVGLVATVLAPVGWYASHVAPYRLQVVRAEVALPAERAGRDPVRVGVLADLQTSRITSYEQGAVADLLAERPDVILLAGDVYEGPDEAFDEQLPAFRALLGQLEAPGGVFAVRGDTDTGDRLDRLLDGTQVRILDDEVVRTEVGDRTVRIAGNRLRWAPVEGLAARDDLAESDPGAVRILLAHRPEVVTGLAADDQVDLTVAGHTHGGQVAIPGVGPVMALHGISRSVAAGGLHEVGGHPVFVSTGVGMVRRGAPQIRLFTRPSIGIVTLR